MAELACVYPNESVSVRALAERLEISAKYLEQIMAALKAAGLIESERGIRGGYRLARPPEHVTLAEVFRVFEGCPSPVACVEDPAACPNSKACPTLDTWAEIRVAIEEILEGTSLQDLCERKRGKAASGAPMYYI
jgi:Rrf2 family protein